MGQAPTLFEDSAGRLATAGPPVDFHALGLAGCIDVLTAPLRRGGTSIRWETPHHGVEISAAAATLLYQAAQITLSNVLVHANANHVTIRLAAVYHGIRLTITDNGVGFEVNSVDSANDDSSLRRMLLALDEAGGIITIQSGPGNGTKVTITLALD